MRVWVTRKGHKSNVYHTDEDCRHLSRAHETRAVDVETIPGFDECSICKDGISVASSRKLGLRDKISVGKIDPEDHAPEF